MKITLAFLLLLFLPAVQFIVYADQNIPEIFISEILPDGVGSDSGKEWLELYNMSSAVLNLKGWSITTTSSSGSIRTTVLSEDIFIQPSSYLLILESEDLYSGVNKFVVGAGKLNFFNSNATISLNSENGVTVDQLTFGSGQEGRSFERSGPLCSNVMSHIEGNTIGVTNSNYNNQCWPASETSDPISYLPPLPPPSEPELSPTLQISEVYPSPNSGEEEWIEVYNYGAFDLTLQDFYFKEVVNGLPGSTKSYLGNGVIVSHAYLVVSDESLGVSLNNAGDTIYLYYKNDIVDTFKYPSTTKGSSASREYKGGKYEIFYFNDLVPLSILPTPAEHNRFPIEEPLLVVSIAEAKRQVRGTSVSVQGVVTAELGLFGNDIFYIQDESGGIKVRVVTEVVLNVLRNNFIRVTGTLQQSSGEFYLKVIEVSEGSGAENSIFTLRYESSNAEDLTGSVVTATGDVIRKYASGFVLGVGDDEVRVGISDLFEDFLVELVKGDTVIVTGVLIKSSSAYKIMPRDQTDMRLVLESNTIFQDESSAPLSFTTSTLGLTTPRELVLPEYLSNTSAKSSKPLVHEFYLWPIQLGLLGMNFIVRSFLEGKFSGLEEAYFKLLG